MGTNSADPGLMDNVAGSLDAHADDIETWGQAAASTMYAHGYSYGATATAGSTYGSASWARGWAGSLRSRASMLEAYHAISLMGSSAAGGAGAALAAGHQWAFTEPGTLRFEDWYAERMASLADRMKGAERSAAFEDALEQGDYASMWDIIQQLDAMASPHAAAGFFNGLGAETTALVPNELIGMTSMSDVYLRATVGHPGDLVSLLSLQLAAASTTGELNFAGSDLIEADLAAGPFASQYFTGYGAEYLFVADGFDPQFLADAVAAYLPYQGHPVIAQQVVVSNIDGQFPIDAREFLLPNVAAARAGSELVLQLIDAGRLDALLSPYVSYDELGANAVAPILEQATLDLFAEDPVAAQYVIGSLITFIAAEDARGYLDIVAASLMLIMPQLDGVVNGETNSAWLGMPDGREVLVTKDDLWTTFSSFAHNDAAAAALYEGILVHYGNRIGDSDGDPEELTRIAISLADLSTLLTTAIADGNISDAKDRDERMAAIIGLVDTLASLVPLPGATTVGSKFAASLIKTTYNELVDRGLELLETNHEGAAREQADAFYEALLFGYTELLTLGHLQSQGTGAVETSIDAFFVAHPHLDPEVYDFSDGAGALLTDLTDRQAQAYGQWITFASANAEVNDAVSRLLAESLVSLPHYDN